MRDYSTFFASRTSAERKLISDSLYKRLLENGERTQNDPEHNALDLPPVCKLFTPDANATWLLVEADPDEPNRLWGIGDLGLGCVEFGTVWFPELHELRGQFGLPLERDRYRKLDKPMRYYLEKGDEVGSLSGIA